MIKEFFRQLYLHLEWFYDYPSHFIIVLKSFCCFLWHGYSFDDIADIDLYILHKLSELIPLYQKRSDAVPMPLNEKEWTNELNKLKNNIKKLETEDLNPKQEMRVQNEISDFLSKYFWYLWY